MTSVLLVGAGAVGARAARQLVEADDVDEVVIVDPNGSRREAVVASTGDKAVDGGWGEPVRETDAVLLAGPSAAHVDQAREHMAQGRPVVSLADGLADAHALLHPGPAPSEPGVPVLAGAGRSPGSTTRLARSAGQPCR